MDKFNKCVWLARQILNAKEHGITLSEIQERWLNAFAQDGEKEFCRRSFENYRHYVENMFDINIQCHLGDYTYYVESKEHTDSLKIWLLNSFSLQNKMSSDTELRKRVQFEQFPGGTRFLETIMSAMQENKALNMEYHSYRTDPYTTNVFPYALKQYKQRWYMIASVDGKKIRTYALDRIKNLSMTDIKFMMPQNFNLKEYYSDHFGIIHNDDYSAQTIKIKIFKEQVPYVKGLPWHDSQQIIEETEEYTVFSWYMCPSFDLLQNVLSLGYRAEVMEPQCLKDWVINEMQGALSHYNK